MNIKEKMKSYSFWVSLTSAVVLVVKLVGQKYGLVIDDGFISDLVTSLCGILVILGIIVLPAKKDNPQKNNNQLADDANYLEKLKDTLDSTNINKEELSENDIVSKDFDCHEVKNFSQETEDNTHILDTNLNSNLDDKFDIEDNQTDTNITTDNQEYDSDVAVQNTEFTNNENSTKVGEDNIASFVSEQLQPEVDDDNKLKEILSNPEKLEALNQILSNFLQSHKDNE